MNSTALPTKVLEILLELYDQDTASKLFPELLDLLDFIPTVPPKAYPNAHRDQQWYRDLRLYVTYPDSFVDDTGKADLWTLAKHVPKIRELGCNAIHVLPFLKSPQIDKGFDVSDYLNVDPVLGGNEALENLISVTKEHDIALFMDMVFNHVSSEHEWFQKAVNGDEFYRKFFITTNTKPTLLERYQRDGVQFAKYLWNGQELEIQINFPDQAGEIPHWELQKDGFWYYHSFYPQQIDLDWNNPQVLKEMLKIMIYWAAKGMNFRLDAILAIFKRLTRGHLVKTQRTYKMLELFHLVLKTVSPYAVLLPETLDLLENAANTTGFDEEHIRTELIYNFELSANLWLAIATESAAPLWRVLPKHSNLPNWVVPVNFLRNHDELNIELISMPEKIKTTEVLLQLEGLWDAKAGINGRTASFLKDDPRKVILAHMLLFALPGAHAIVYGDEYGKSNDQAFAEEQLKLKQEKGLTNVKFEHRDIGRGRVSEELINSSQGQYIFSSIKSALNLRSQFGKPLAFYKIDGEVPESVFAIREVFETAEVITLINLCSRTQSARIDTSKLEHLLDIGCPLNNNGEIILPPYAGAWFRRIA